MKYLKNSLKLSLFAVILTLLQGCASIVSSCPPPVWPSDTVMQTMQQHFPDDGQNNLAETRNWYFDQLELNEKLEFCRQ